MEVFLGHGFVVGERGQFQREEFSVSVYSSFFINIWHIVHMLDYLRRQFFVFFFGVLFVEDAVRFSPKSNATEKISRTMTIVRILNIVTAPYYDRKFTSRTANASIYHFIQ